MGRLKYKTCNFLMFNHRRPHLYKCMIIPCSDLSFIKRSSAGRNVSAILLAGRRFEISIFYLIFLILLNMFNFSLFGIMHKLIY